MHAGGTPVALVGTSLDETVAFGEPHHGRHGLLGEPRAPGYLADAKAVLLEQREKHGAV